MQILRISNTSVNQSSQKNGYPKFNTNPQYSFQSLVPLNKDTVSFSGVSAALAVDAISSGEKLLGEINKLKESLSVPKQAKKAIEQIVDTLVASPAAKQDGRYAFVLDKNRKPIFETMLDEKMSSTARKYIDYIESIDKSADLNIKNDWAMVVDDNLTPYFNLAIEKGQFEVADRIIKFIKKRGDKVKISWLVSHSKNGETPFECAINNNQIQLAEKIIDVVDGLKDVSAKNAWLLKQSLYKRYSYFNSAILNNNPIIANKIVDVVDKSSDYTTVRSWIMLENHCGDSAFVVASENKQPEIAKRVLKLLEKLNPDAKRAWIRQYDVNCNSKFDTAMLNNQQDLAKDVFMFTSKTLPQEVLNYGIKDIKNVDDYMEMAKEIATSSEIQNKDILSFLERNNKDSLLNDLIKDVKQGVIEKKAKPNAEERRINQVLSPKKTKPNGTEKQVAQVLLPKEPAKKQAKEPVIKHHYVKPLFMPEKPATIYNRYSVEYDEKLASIDEEYSKVKDKENIYKLFG